MPRNHGKTTLKRRRSQRDPMTAYDRLPRDLRLWLAGASLPWRAQSVRAAYEQALKRTRDRKAALAELDRIEARLIARDAARIWGPAHPAVRL